jgi:hypothetical protein
VSAIIYYFMDYVEKLILLCGISDGSLYEGSFRKGKRHGHGKLVSDIGTVYEGEWKFDKRHGSGRYLMVCCYL